MTKEQLADWRAKGFVFDETADQVAKEPDTKEDENAKIKEIKENEAFLSAFTKEKNEDAEDRCIRKVLHMIRNFKPVKRKLNISMTANVYVAINLDLNGTIIKRITLEAKPKDRQNIDLSKFEDIDYKYNVISGISYTGICFDKKLSIFVTSKKDKQVLMNYINNVGKDDFVPAFSKFSLATIKKGITALKTAPYKIAQRSTPLCGIAAVGVLMAKYQYNQFSQMIYDLYYYAEAFYNKNNYLIKPRNGWPFDQVYNIDPAQKDYPKMEQCDYILLTSIKSSENDTISFDGKDDDSEMVDGTGGLTTSGELSKLLKSFLLGSDVVDNTDYTGNEFNELAAFKSMDHAWLNKTESIMLIDMRMLTEYSNWTWEDKIFSEVPFPNHWVLYAGHSFDSGSQLSFKVYSWGKEVEVKNLPYEQFKDTFYGYVQCKL